MAMWHPLSSLAEGEYASFLLGIMLLNTDPKALYLKR